jgi:hypothetical protein
MGPRAARIGAWASSQRNGMLHVGRRPRIGSACSIKVALPLGETDCTVSKALKSLYPEGKPTVLWPLGKAGITVGLRGSGRYRRKTATLFNAWFM